MKNSLCVSSDASCTKNTAELLSSFNINIQDIHLNPERTDGNTPNQSDFVRALIHCLHVV